MNNFQAGDIVRTELLVQVFGKGDLIVSKVKGDGERQWVSIEGYPQDGSATYISRAFKLVSSGIAENE